MKISVINGPNINFVGIREKSIYGTRGYADIFSDLKKYAEEKGAKLEVWQSNHEGAIIDKIQSFHGSDTNAVIINPGAYTHYSYAIADAIKSIDTPFVEVHFSDINSREDFRKISVTKEACKAQISGKGEDGYKLAVDMILSGEIK